MEGDNLFSKQSVGKTLRQIGNVEVRLAFRIRGLSTASAGDHAPSSFPNDADVVVAAHHSSLILESHTTHRAVVSSWYSCLERQRYVSFLKEQLLPRDSSRARDSFA